MPFIWFYWSDNKTCCFWLVKRAHKRYFMISHFSTPLSLSLLKLFFSLTRSLFGMLTVDNNCKLQTRENTSVDFIEIIIILLNFHLKVFVKISLKLATHPKNSQTFISISLSLSRRQIVASDYNYLLNSMLLHYCRCRYCYCLQIDF